MLYLIKKIIRKSQLSLFGNTHQETHGRKGTTRHMISGKAVNVRPGLMLVRVKDKPKQPDLFSYTPQKFEHEQEVYFKTPSMNRAKRGHIVGHTEGEGWHVRGMWTDEGAEKGSKVWHRPVHIVPEEHIMTKEQLKQKNGPKGTRPKVTPEISLQRQQAAQEKTGINEAELLTHPVFLRQAKTFLSRVASTNGMNPHYINNNGVLNNDDTAANELYGQYIDAAIGAMRTAGSKATPEDVQELRNHLDGISQNSRIIGQIHRTAKTAVFRHLNHSQDDPMTNAGSYDSAMEDDMESGMRSIAAKGATQHASVTAETSREALENMVDRLIGVERPTDAAILKMRFGLGRFDHAYKSGDVAAALNKMSLPAPEGHDKWTSETVKERAKETLARLARDKSVQHLRAFLKSLRDIREEELIKSHIKEYTREDGTVVQEHDDKRVKHHADIMYHTNKHEEHIHSGAKLKHGAELINHLAKTGWKKKDTFVVHKTEGATAGKKHDMPHPPKQVGKTVDQNDHAVIRAKKTMSKMRDETMKSEDPIAALKAMHTHKDNTSGKAIHQYRKQLLEHFGHEIDETKKNTRLEKDGHVVSIGDDGVISFAGVDLDHGKKEDNSVNPAKDTLTQAIAKIGGMHSGEAKRQFDLTGKDFPAIRSSLKKDGLDPDKVAEILSQHGYIKTDEHGKHDYDDFQDKLRRAATGDKVYSVQRDSKDVEDELAQQEKEYIESRGIDDPSSEAQGFEYLHPEMQKEYKSVFEEALDVLGKEATFKLVAMYQHDVPFDVKEYVDAQLRRHIDEHKGHGKQGDDSKVGKQGSTGGSGQAAAVDSGNDTGKGATRPSPVRKSHREERTGSCLRAYAYVLRRR